MVGGRLMLFGRYWFTTPARSDTVGSLNEENEDARGHGFVGDPGLGGYFDSVSWYLPRENVGGDLMIEREKLLAIAERLDAWAGPVSSGQDAALAMHDAAEALRSAARTGPDVAGFEVCREAAIE
jgi:hypothetical protein